MSLLECLEYIEGIKHRLSSKNFNDNANILFCLICLLFLVYFFFYKTLLKLLIRSKINPSKQRQTINFAWNFIFYFTSTCFLILYHTYFIKDELDREVGKWYPKRRDLLFYQPCDMVKFKVITCIISAFHICGSILDFQARDIAEAISKLLYALLTIVCYMCGYENYSVILNINLGLFHFFTEMLSCLSLHSERDQIMIFQVFVTFKFISWIYIFLNFLPFQYLIPSLYAKDFQLELTVCFVAWYISKIWCSPLLHIAHHQLYHLNAFECQGDNSLARCLMLKDTPELRHQKSLKRAFLGVKLYHQRHQINKLNLSDSAASAKAFQTIKAVMTIKRKLKRIREHRGDFHEEKIN